MTLQSTQQLLREAPRKVLTSEDRILGFTKAELLFFGLMAGGFASGCAGLDHWADLTHPKIIVSIVMQLGAAAVAFSTGRMSK